MNPEIVDNASDQWFLDCLLIFLNGKSLISPLTFSTQNNTETENDEGDGETQGEDPVQEPTTEEPDQGGDQGGDEEVPVVEFEPLHGVLLEVVIDEAVEDAIVMDQLPPRLQVLHGAARFWHASNLFTVGELRPWLGALLDLLTEVDEEVAANSRELAVADERAVLEGALEHRKLDLRDEIVVDWFRLVVVVDLRKLRLAR